MSARDLGAQILGIVSGLLLGLLLSASLSIPVESTLARDQGCVNQGDDLRLMALPVCWAQRHLSWKSYNEPYFISFGNPRRMNLGLAWPPYLVMNWRIERRQWRMFRIGVRYDRNWHGYIFPTLALKNVRRPLQY